MREKVHNGAERNTARGMFAISHFTETNIRQSLRMSYVNSGFDVSLKLEIHKSQTGELRMLRKRKIVRGFVISKLLIHDPANKFCYV